MSYYNFIYFVLAITNRKYIVALMEYFKRSKNAGLHISLPLHAHFYSRQIFENVGSLLRMIGGVFTRFADTRSNQQIVELWFRNGP